MSIDYGKVAVLMGGDSAERDISINTGNAVLGALKRQKIDAHGIDTNDISFIDELRNGGYERAFIALHGRGGEDGVIQGLLDTLKIPYTGSKVMGSAICMDKHITKRIWQTYGLPTPPFGLVSKDQDPAIMIKSLGLPLAVKPVYEGSSVGIKKLTNFFDLYETIEEASKFGPVILEQWIEGDEYTVSILDTEALPSIKIVSGGGFYDYDSKYVASDTKYICPSPLTEEQEKNIRLLSLKAFRAVGASGWGRVDLIRDLNGDFWLLEVNTVPGLTQRSLVPKAALQAGISFDDLVVRILNQTIEQNFYNDLKGKTNKA